MWQLHEHQKRTATQAPAKNVKDGDFEESSAHVVSQEEREIAEEHHRSTFMRTRDRALEYRSSEHLLEFVRHQHILVVCSERVISDTLVTILRAEGYPALAAYSGGDAIDRARAIRPLLVLADIIMPDISGVEVAIQLTTEDPDCRAVLFTGWTGAMELVQIAKEIGFEFEVWPAPIHPQSLLERVRSLRTEKRNKN
jgi:CheY-like chemotaxis protein